MTVVKRSQSASQPKADGLLPFTHSQHMKKIIACIVLLVTCIVTAAENSTIAQLLKKAIEIPAERLVTGEVVEEVVAAGFNAAGDGKYAPYFGDFFHNVRHAVYYRSDVHRILFDEIQNQNMNRDWYSDVRAIFVSKLKKWLHTGTNLCDTYESSYRATFQRKISTLSPRQKVIIAYRLASIQKVFAMMKTAKVQNAFITYHNMTLEGSPERMSNFEALAKNMNEQQIANLILSDTSDVWIKEATAAREAFDSMFEDKRLAEFAGRRYIEGGDQLISKYMLLIEMMIEDVVK